MRRFAIILTLLLSTTLFAHDDYRYGYDHGYTDGYYEGRNYKIKKRRFVKVIESIPIYEDVVTYKKCRPHRRHGHVHSPEGALLGGLIGGIIGHHIDSDHRVHTTIGGAVAGAIIGSKIGPTHHYRKCKQVETRLVGYKNIAYWRGEKIVRISDVPLRKIRIGRRYRR
ncbi:MAG: glycine zipper 2TM domain-containing protein [Sulfurimonadaceae bacterium]|nr:glycine zipper 2TM domain-containing protein [Sulfurimonadaceae bacterium]